MSSLEVKDQIAVGAVLRKLRAQLLYDIVFC